MATKVTFKSRLFSKALVTMVASKLLLSMNEKEMSPKMVFEHETLFTELAAEISFSLEKKTY